MSRFSSLYKQTGPTRRVVQGENSYEKGMYWTTGAAGQGYVHTLLNYEIDQLSYDVHVAGGLHATDVAAGCTYLDRATFGEGNANIIVLQNRNEYNLRAFEGITNIISANKLTIKNNQTLEEKLRQQGFTADDVVCYKLLTYNPVNHRLMSVTLIQAKRDKYFVIDNEYQLRRINSNPISCGFSEVWDTLDGNTYVSNRLNYHTQGADDNYTPRARRNSYDETFGQKLHSPLYMQTVPNCEGYGNKTFCFTKKKQTKIEGTIKDTTEITYENVVKFYNFGLGTDGNLGDGFQIGDKIVVQPVDTSLRRTPHIVEITETQNYSITATLATVASGFNDSTSFVINIPNNTLLRSKWNRAKFAFTTSSGQILSAPTIKTKTELSTGRAVLINSDASNIYVQYNIANQTFTFTSNIPNGVVITTSFQYYNENATGLRAYKQLSEGIFAGVRTDYNNNSFETYVERGNQVVDLAFPPTWTAVNLTNTTVVASVTQPDVITEDVYFKHINTGIATLYNAVLDNKPVPIDAFRYGLALTGCAIVPEGVPTWNSSVTPLTDKLWDKALVDIIKTGDNSTVYESLFKLDLTDGTLTPTQYAINNNTDLEIRALPYLNRGITGAPTSLFEPDSVFEGTAINEQSHNLVIENWGSSPDAIHPSTWLKESIKLTKRKGQGFRFAVYCTSSKNPTRYLNTLREDPLSSKYYNQEITAVFILDYVWNGTSWEFSFVDTSIDMYDSSDNALTLVENWELDGKDELGNTISRHYVWLNSLAYTDVLSELNIKDMAEHIVDNLDAPKAIYDKDNDSVYYGSIKKLKQDLNETIDSSFPEELNIVNKSKLADISYGHFEVTPKSLTPGEAALWGYNMLSNTPYTFECIDTPGTETASLDGILLKSAKDTNKVLLKPVINTPGIIEIYYSSDQAAFDLDPDAERAFQLTVEYKNPVDEWRDLKKYTAAETHNLLATGSPIQISFIGADETVMIRATLRDLAVKEEVPNSDSTDIQEEFLVVDQMITTFSFAKDSTKTEPSPEIYDLGSATGITYWKGRLVLWGVLNAENMLFMSEPNEPEYFAYPNGVDIFEENIVHVIPYSDSLVVFTSTKLWRLDMNTDGLSWNKALLQQNLRISDLDIPYITILKNMLFFKSDKQFYMLVPSKSSTVGELTIAPISKPIQDLLANPFAALRDIVHTVYPDLAGRTYTSPMLGSLDPDGDLIDIPELPITDYLVKYGVHTEQSRIMIDWWFDITDWKAQASHYSDRTVHHDVTLGATPNDSATYLNKEYWLVQLIYDTQTYGWTMRTHTTNSIGIFIADAVNQDTDFINLTFCPESSIGENSKLFNDNAKATWGIAISHRRKPADRLLKEFSLGEDQTALLESTYPRFQVFDTGYKEVSSPALKKRFREIQLSFEPDPETEEGLRAAYTAMIDGHTVMSAVSQEVFEETEVDPITGTHTIIKIVDRLNFHDDNLLDPNAPPNYVPLPYLVDGQLSNTFVLDSSALAGVSQVKIRRQINGKGYLVRARFINITHASYSLANYSFVSHNKNAR